MTTVSLNIPTGRYYQGKKAEVAQIILSFHSIETINESYPNREMDEIFGKNYCP